MPLADPYAAGSGVSAPNDAGTREQVTDRQAAALQIPCRVASNDAPRRRARVSHAALLIWA